MILFVLLFKVVVCSYVSDLSNIDACRENDGFCYTQTTFTVQLTGPRDSVSFKTSEGDYDIVFEGMVNQLIMERFSTTELFDADTWSRGYFACSGGNSFGYFPECSTSVPIEPFELVRISSSGRGGQPSCSGDTSNWAYCLRAGPRYDKGKQFLTAFFDLSFRHNGIKMRIDGTQVSLEPGKPVQVGNLTINLMSSMDTIPNLSDLAIVVNRGDWTYTPRFSYNFNRAHEMDIDKAGWWKTSYQGFPNVPAGGYDGVTIAQLSWLKDNIRNLFKPVSFPNGRYDLNTGRRLMNSFEIYRKYSIDVQFDSLEDWSPITSAAMNSIMTNGMASFEEFMYAQGTKMKRFMIVNETMAEVKIDYPDICVWWLDKCWQYPSLVSIFYQGSVRDGKIMNNKLYVDTIKAVLNTFVYVPTSSLVISVKSNDIYPKVIISECKPKIIEANMTHTLANSSERICNCELSTDSGYSEKIALTTETKWFNHTESKLRKIACKTYSDTYTFSVGQNVTNNTGKDTGDDQGEGKVIRPDDEGSFWDWLGLPDIDIDIDLWPDFEFDIPQVVIAAGHGFLFTKIDNPIYLILNALCIAAGFFYWWFGYFVCVGGLIGTWIFFTFFTPAGPYTALI